METLSYTAARERLAEMMNTVCEDNVPVAITRRGHGAVVVVSMDEYHALEETAHLLRSPKNMRRLLTSVIELANSEGQERELIDETDICE